MKLISISLALCMCSNILFGQTPCSLDNSFDTDGKIVSDGSRTVDCVTALPNGLSIITYNPMSTGHVYLRKLTANGTVDNSFGVNGKLNLQVASSRTEVKDLLYYNNQVYCCGTTSTGTNTYPFIARFHLNGKMDSTFGYNGYNYNVQHYSYNSLAIESGTGKILVGGMKDFDELMVTRYHSSGYIDGNFGNLGITTYTTAASGQYYEVRHLNLDQSGKIILTGKYYVTQGATFSKIFVVRLNSDGSKDNTFSSDGIEYYNSSSQNYDEGRRIFANAQNDYYIIGATWKFNLDYDYTLMKIKNNGSLDNNFDTDGWKLYNLGGNSPEEYLLNGAMMSNGNLLLTGNQGSGDTVYFSMLMVKPDGTPDNNFAPNGLYKHIFGVNNNNSSAALSLSDDGKVYLGGYTRTCANGTCGPLYAGISRYVVGEEVATSITETAEKNSCFIYPSLITSNQWINFRTHLNTPVTIEAFTLFGQRIAVEINGSTFRLPNAPVGIYVIEMSSSESLLNRFKIQIQ